MGCVRVEASRKLFLYACYAKKAERPQRRAQATTSFHAVGGRPHRHPILLSSPSTLSSRKITARAACMRSGHCLPPSLPSVLLLLLNVMHKQQSGVLLARRERSSNRKNRKLIIFHNVCCVSLSCSGIHRRHKKHVSNRSSTSRFGEGEEIAKKQKKIQWHAYAHIDK